MSQLSQEIIFTAHVWSMTGRLCFDMCLSVCPQGGGQSADSGGGVRSSWGGQVQPGGVRSRWGGGGQVQLVGGGSCIARGGGQVQPVGGVRSSQQGGGGSLYGRRYASCIHAGGLSCLSYFVSS